MLALRTFNKKIQQISSSNLNFQLQESPFSAQISLKKSLVKEKDGSIRLPPTVSPKFCKDSKIEALEKQVKNLEKVLESLRNKYSQSVGNLEEAEKKIKELEDVISNQIKNEHDQEVFDLEIVNNRLRGEIADLEKSVDTKNKISERLQKELSENKKKAEKDKAIMIKAHKVEVKSWRKDLGEERKQTLKLEKQLKKKLDDSIASKHSSPKYFLGETFNPACSDCDDTFDGDISDPDPNGRKHAQQCVLRQPFSPPTPSKPSLGKNEMIEPRDLFEPSFLPSMVSHWNPNFTKSFQRSSNITTMISHCVLLPPPGSSFITMAEVVEAFDKIFAKMKYFN